MENEHPLSGFRADIEQLRGEQTNAYEEKIVGYLLSRFKLTKHKVTLLHKQRELTGSARLTLGQFDNEFPDFPTYLAVAKIPYIAKDGKVDKLFNRFPSRKMVSRYEELVESIPEEYDGQFGLIMPWPYVSRGVILHNDQVSVPDHPGIRIVWTRKGKARKFAPYMILEPLPQYLDTLRWQQKEGSDDDEIRKG